VPRERAAARTRADDDHVIVVHRFLLTRAP
jgi:hypothetical protein